MPLQPNIVYTPNQPQTIDVVGGIYTDEGFNFNNIVNADDITKFQFKLYPHPNVPALLANEEFNGSSYNVSGQWYLGQATYQSLFGGYVYNTNNVTTTIYQTLSNVSENAFVEVTINFEQNNSGGYIDLGSQRYELPKNVTGEQKYYFIVESGAQTLYIVSYPTVYTKSFIVTYARMREVSLNYIFVLRDNNGDVVSSKKLYTYINSTNIYGSTPFRRIDNYITYSHDWTGEPEGCYTIEVLDSIFNTNMQNGLHNAYFNVDDIDADGSSLGWIGTKTETLGNLVTVTINASGQLTVDVPAVNNHGWSLVSRTNTLAGVIYNINILVVSTTGTVSISYGTIINETGATVSGAGLLTDTFVGDGNPFIFRVYSTGAARTIVLSYILVELANENDYVANYESNGFSLTNSSDNTIEISACNDVDSFGFSFPTSDFSLNTRLKGKITNPQYDSDREAYINNAGNTRTTYFRRQKIKLIKIDLVPEYMLDFLTLLGGMDHIYINDLEFVPSIDEFIQVNYDQNLDNFAKVILFLFQKDSTAFKKVTTALGPGCGTTPSYLVDPHDINDPDDDENIIDPQTGDPILSLE